MSWGSELKKNIELAAKQKLDVSAFKGYDKFCKTLDDMEKIHNILKDAVKDVEKFIAYPKAAAVRDIAIFFKYKAEYVEYAKSIEQNLYPWVRAADALIKKQDAKSKEGKLASDTYNAIRREVASVIPYADTTQPRIIYLKDPAVIIKEAKQNYDERQKEALEELTKKQEKERQTFEQVGLTDWKALYAALDKM